MKEIEKELLIEDVEFNEEDHTYTGTVSKADYISATTLLKKYGMTPDEYAYVPEEILKAKAAYGTEVHAGLEKYINGDEVQKVLYPEVQAFADWLDEKKLTTFDCISEKKVFNEYYKIAGTVDLQVWNTIGDFKTTSTLHMVPVMWQLSLYNFLLHPNEEDYNMYELKVFWFSASGELTVRDVPLVPYLRLLSLLEAYRKGEEVWVDESLSTDLVEQVEAIIKQERLIKTVKKNLKSLENEKEVLKVSIEDKMKEESRIYVDAPSGVITITEVATSRYDNKLIDELLLDTGKPKKDYIKTTIYTRMNIKDKAK